MFTARKRHLKKKRFFLSKQTTFALFNGSNLKTSKITEIRLSLPNAKLYYVPLYLNPPKLGIGYPLIMIIFNELKDLQLGISELLTKIDCVGVHIEKKWYPIKLLKTNNKNTQTKTLLTLFLVKKKKKNKT